MGHCLALVLKILGSLGHDFAITLKGALLYGILAMALALALLLIEFSRIKLSKAESLIGRRGRRGFCWRLAFKAATRS